MFVASCGSAARSYSSGCGASMYFTRWVRIEARGLQPNWSRGKKVSLGVQIDRWAARGERRDADAIRIGAGTLARVRPRQLHDCWHLVDDPNQLRDSARLQ